MKDAIEDLCKSIDYKKYNLIIKLHPLSKIEYDSKDAIVDNSFSTMEMLSVSNYVISDYSSIIYEAGVMNKKLLFYAFDLDEYKNKRDFFIDYNNDLPGPIVKSGSEVYNFLKKPDYSKYKNKTLISDYVDLSIDNYTNNMCSKIKEIL